jgi:hypothetical protein
VNRGRTPRVAEAARTGSLVSHPLSTYTPPRSPNAVIATLRANKAALRLRGVAHAALFGSVARGEAGPDSDIDIMVEINAAAGVDLYDYVGIRRFIGELFADKADVSEREALKGHVRPGAERDAIHAF